MVGCYTGGRYIAVAFAGHTHENDSGPVSSEEGAEGHREGSMSSVDALAERLLKDHENRWQFTSFARDANVSGVSSDYSIRMRMCDDC